ncbi:cell-wall agglutinin N-terminal ligand-sugar binding-domain-containing protein [Scheffersomyces coipomensis]|uniref:cell-wall agglutinin N-terminal ligand-sugar binding-domain-containing protein n=1 Tax=Scheffersomyces coipomensis TaxID=1788519 RepID=UPI00315D871E
MRGITILLSLVFHISTALAVIISSDTIVHNNYEISSGGVQIYDDTYLAILGVTEVSIAGDIIIETGGNLYINDSIYSGSAEFSLCNQLGDFTNNGSVTLETISSFLANYFYISATNSFINNGEMFLGYSGITNGGANYISGSSIINNGLMTFYQAFSNPDSVILDGTFTNNGQICLYNKRFYQVSEINGVGCITIQQQGIMEITSPLSYLQGQTFFLAGDESMIIVYPAFGTETITVAGFGNGNIIALDDNLQSINYDESGILTICSSGQGCQDFDIGQGYNSLVFETEINNQLGSYGVYYPDPPPNPGIPLGCSVFTELPIFPSSISTTSSSSITSSSSASSSSSPSRFSSYSSRRSSYSSSTSSYSSRRSSSIYSPSSSSIGMSSNSSSSSSGSSISSTSSISSLSKATNSSLPSSSTSLSSSSLSSTFESTSASSTESSTSQSASTLSNISETALSSNTLSSISTASSNPGSSSSTSNSLSFPSSALLSNAETSSMITSSTHSEFSSSTTSLIESTTSITPSSASSLITSTTTPFSIQPSAISSFSTITSNTLSSFISSFPSVSIPSSYVSTSTTSISSQSGSLTITPYSNSTISYPSSSLLSETLSRTASISTSTEYSISSTSASTILSESSSSPSSIESITTSLTTSFTSNESSGSSYSSSISISTSPPISISSTSPSITFISSSSISIISSFIESSLFTSGVSSESVPISISGTTLGSSSIASNSIPSTNGSITTSAESSPTSGSGPTTIYGVFDTSMPPLSYVDLDSYYTASIPMAPAFDGIFSFKFSGNAQPGDIAHLVLPNVFDIFQGTGGIVKRADGTTSLSVDDIDYADCIVTMAGSTNDETTVDCTVNSNILTNPDVSGSITLPLVFNIGGSTSPTDIQAANAFVAGYQPIIFNDGLNDILTSAIFAAGSPSPGDPTVLVYASRPQPWNNIESFYVLGGNCTSSTGSGEISISVTDGSIDCSSWSAGITNSLNAWYFPTTYETLSSITVASCGPSFLVLSYYGVPTGYRLFVSVDAETDGSIQATFNDDHSCAALSSGSSVIVGSTISVSPTVIISTYTTSTVFSSSEIITIVINGVSETLTTVLPITSLETITTSFTELIPIATETTGTEITKSYITTETVITTTITTTFCPVGQESSITATEVIVTTIETTYCPEEGANTSPGHPVTTATAAITTATAAITTATATVITPRIETPIATTVAAVETQNVAPTTEIVTETKEGETIVEITTETVGSILTIESLISIEEFTGTEENTTPVYYVHTTGAIISEVGPIPSVAISAVATSPAASVSPEVSVIEGSANRFQYSFTVLLALVMMYII